MQELILLYIVTSIVVIFFIVIILGMVFWRKIVRYYFVKIFEFLVAKDYDQSLVELIPGVKKVGLQTFFENSLRAETGDLLYRPLGASKDWPHFDTITFIPAQTTPFPLDKERPVDLSVTIGPKAKQPLRVDIPLLISGMAYGVGVSKKVHLALTKASKNLGTAINSGEGGILAEALQEVDRFILQYSKTSWAKSDKVLARANMIEIKLGQGAKAGVGVTLTPSQLTGYARQVMGLLPDEDAVIHEHFFEKQTLADLKKLVADLREVTDGVPIGMKLGAGGRLEEDLDRLLQLGVDFISLDGGQAATHSVNPILADSFGIPTLHALARARKHLDKRGVGREVSLLISGGLFTPSHFLKALALGADAVYLGSSILFATAHRQTGLALPFSPPTQVMWHEGKYKHAFDENLGEKYATNFLKSCVKEMEVALRVMGKESLLELSKKDLVAYDYVTAKMLQIPYSFEPFKTDKRS